MPMNRNVFKLHNKRSNKLQINFHQYKAALYVQIPYDIDFISGQMSLY